MLVLNRKVGEKICIDGAITVIVNRIHGNRVSLAIEAPHDVHVVRGELRPFVADLAPTAGNDSRRGRTEKWNAGVSAASQVPASEILAAEQLAHG